MLSKSKREAKRLNWAVRGILLVDHLPDELAAFFAVGSIREEAAWNLVRRAFFPDGCFPVAVLTEL